MIWWIGQIAWIIPRLIHLLCSPHHGWTRSSAVALLLIVPWSSGSHACGAFSSNVAFPYCADLRSDWRHEWQFLETPVNEPHNSTFTIWGLDLMEGFVVENSVNQTFHLCFSLFFPVILWYLINLFWSSLNSSCSLAFHLQTCLSPPAVFFLA